MIGTALCVGGQADWWNDTYYNRCFEIARNIEPESSNYYFRTISLCKKRDGGTGGGGGFAGLLYWDFKNLQQQKEVTQCWKCAQLFSWDPVAHRKNRIFRKEKRKIIFICLFFAFEYQKENATLKTKLVGGGFKVTREISTPTPQTNPPSPLIFPNFFRISCLQN